MNEIVKFRNFLTPFINNKENRNAYHFKANAIQNSIYGVDIDAGAVEIAKLRLWLSMVVDENRIDNIEPLPNLDYKIVRGNSLLNMPDSTFRDIALEAEIENAINEYYSITDKEKKQEKKISIDNKIHKLLKSTSEFAGYEIDFDFKLFFHEVWYNKSGFDIIIGNPPYDVYIGTKKNELESIKKIPIYENAKGRKLNAFELFLCLIPHIASKEGILNMIFQNSFLADTSSSKLRKYYFDSKAIIKIDSFPERDNVEKRVFKSAKMSVCIMLSKNHHYVNNRSFNLTVWQDRLMSESFSSKLDLQNICKLEPIYFSIPSVTNSEFMILTKLSSLNKLSYFGHCYEGEVNLTTHKKYLSPLKTKKNYRMIKGASVQKYVIKEKMSQGINEFVEETFITKFKKSKKVKHHLIERIVLQGITGVDETNRLKASILQKGNFCGNSANYVLFNDKISKNIFVALLNSTILNWFFKKYSTNANVNGYEVDNFPIPFCEESVVRPFEILVDYIIFLKSQKDKDKSFYFEQILDGMVYELYFEKELKKAGRNILKHLKDLPEITDKIGESKKQEIITKVFNKYYDKESPVRNNLFYMKSIEEIKIIEESLKK